MCQSHAEESLALPTLPERAILEDLLRRARCDKIARNELVLTFGPLLRIWSHRWLNVACDDARSSILQSVVRRILTNFDRLPGTEPELLAYIGAIVRNRCHDEWRRRLKQPRSLRPADDASDDTLAKEELERRAVLVFAALQVLPERYREVLELTAYDGMSCAEIGAVLKVSEGAAKVLRCRALKKLRPLLEKTHEHQ